MHLRPCYKHWHVQKLQREDWLIPTGRSLLLDNRTLSWENNEIFVKKRGVGRRTRKIKSPEVWVLRMLEQSKGLSSNDGEGTGWGRMGQVSPLMAWEETGLCLLTGEISHPKNLSRKWHGHFRTSEVWHPIPSKPELWWALDASRCILLLIQGHISRCRNGRHLNPILFSQHLYW